MGDSNERVLGIYVYCYTNCGVEPRRTDAGVEIVERKETGVPKCSFRPNCGKVDCMAYQAFINGRDAEEAARRKGWIE